MSSLKISMIDSEMTELVQKISLCGKLLYEARCVAGNEGNISVKHRNEILITKHRVWLCSIGPSDLTRIDSKDASIDTRIHEEIYLKSTVSCVIHVHGTYIIPVSSRLKDIPVVRDSSLIAEAVVERGVAILEDHGIYAGGNDLMLVCEQLIEIERKAELIYHKLVMSLFNK